jgi:hypothetical protein
MLLSAEVRWFWQGPQPDLQRWFAEPLPHPGGGEERIDTYLVDSSQTELGVKNRGARPGLEFKSLVTERATRQLGRLTASTQIWTKVSSIVLSLAGLPTIATRKRRWLRKYDTSNSTIREIVLGRDERPTSDDWPDHGCNVEFTEVRLDQRSELWTTLGFEAFGGFESLEAGLALTLQYFNSRPLPDLGPGQAFSYPQWLAERFHRTHS